MSDALSDIAKRECAIVEYNKVITFLAERVNNQTNWINNQTWKDEATGWLDIVVDDVLKEVEMMRVNR